MHLLNTQNEAIKSWIFAVFIDFHWKRYIKIILVDTHVENGMNFVKTHFFSVEIGQIPENSILILLQVVQLSSICFRVHNPHSLSK